MMRRQIVIGHAIQIIADTDFQFLEAVEHVELGQGDAMDTGHGQSLPDQYRIEPAATPLPAGNRSEFMATFAKPLADLVVQLGREGAGTDAGRVSLGDTEDIAGTGWSDAGAASRRARNGIGAGDKGIGAVVNIQQHALRAFKQYALAVAPRFVEPFPDRLGILQYAVGDFLQIIE